MSESNRAGAAVSAGGAGAGGADGVRPPERVPVAVEGDRVDRCEAAINQETLRSWLRRAETDAGAAARDDDRRAGPDRALERENRELRRANEILKAAAHFFGAELDRQSPR